MIWKQLYKTTIYIFLITIACLGIFITETNHKKSMDRFIELSLKNEISIINELEVLGNSISFINQDLSVAYDIIRNNLNKSKIEDQTRVYLFHQNELIYSNTDVEFNVSDELASFPLYELHYEVLVEEKKELQINSKIFFSNRVYDRIKIIDISQIFNERISNYRLLIIFGLLSLSVTSLIYYRLSKHMIAPLEHVVNHLEVIGKGDYSQSLELSNNHDYDDIVTAVNQMQSNVMSASETLKAQNRKQSLFIRNMNHEIRTPITSIIGYADILNHQNVTDEMKEEAVRFIKHEGQRLSELSKKMSNILFVEDYILNEQIIHTKSIEKHLIQMYQPHERFDDLSFCFEDLTIEIDSDLIYMYCVNVIDNAIKATQVNEKIHVQLLCQDTLVLKVIDEGIGFDYSILSDVFEPFVKGRYTKESDGTGLGLSICHHIGNMLNGEMTIEENNPKGTIVSLKLKEVKHV